MSVAQFRQELVDTINDMDDLSATLYLSSNIHPPCAVIDYELNEAIVFAHGAYQYTWHIGLVTQRHDDRGAQQFFDKHKDPSDTTSLWRVLSDRTWTYADYVRGMSAGQIQEVVSDGVSYLLVDFTMEVVL